MEDSAMNYKLNLEKGLLGFFNLWSLVFLNVGSVLYSEGATQNP